MTRRAAIIRTTTRKEPITVGHLIELATWAKTQGINPRLPIEGIASFRFPYLRELRIVEHSAESTTLLPAPEQRTQA